MNLTLSSIPSPPQILGSSGPHDFNTVYSTFVQYSVYELFQTTLTTKIRGHEFKGLYSIRIRIAWKKSYTRLIQAINFNHSSVKLLLIT